MAFESLQKKSLDSPDETRTFENGKAQITTLGDFNASRFVFEPGHLAASALLIVLIHPSAWKDHSANFALTEFSEVRIKGVLTSQCRSLPRVALG